MLRHLQVALGTTFTIALAFACQGNVGSTGALGGPQPNAPGGTQGSAGAPFASGGAVAGTGGSAAGAGGSAGGVGGSAAGAGPVGCAPDQLSCNGICVVSATDNANCGVCGNPCPAGSSCVQGVCSCPGGGMPCANGCTDTASDSLNCGTCGTACAGGMLCAASTCQCPAPLTACAGACVDVSSDFANCGDCGNACPSGQVCSQGQCGLDCAGGETQCGQSCVNLQTNPAHCNACNNACSGGQQCSGGSCVCPGTTEFCSGQCIDTSENDGNCGSCGNVCSGGRSCNASSCQCPSGQQYCNNQCRTVASDPAHCGACNNACASGSCSNGACAPVSNSGPIGWATVNGNTTGGNGGSVVSVSNASQLTSAVSGSTPRIVQITGTISVSNLDVGSNKTLIGMNNNVTISGGISIDGVSNVIIQNLKINARTSNANGDGINIQGSHHIWIDHCEIWDAPDGNLDITNGANYITVSWTKFWYSSSPPDDAHRYSNLIGAGDGVTSDRDALNITWHHNWWGPRVHERMPRVRFGDVHVFNNYFSSSGNNYCIRAGVEAKIVVENNYFQGVGNPHEIDSDNGTAQMVASGNTYSGTSGARDARGSAFTPPYSYSPEPADNIPSVVQSGAGPR